MNDNETPHPYRAGIDLGGTKIEIAVLGPDGSLPIRRRVPTPDSYGKVLLAIRDLVEGAEAELGAALTTGVCIPGVIALRRSGRLSVMVRMRPASETRIVA